jgi:hypothetical protein
LDYICFKSSTLSCESCYDADVKSCSTELVLKAGLGAATDYYWLLKDKFDKLVQRLVTTNGDGDLTIDLSVLPDGATNPFSGHYELSLRTGDDYLQEVLMTFDSIQYKCVSFKFIEVDDDPENPYNVIQ